MDKKYMKIALKLAEKGWGNTGPNPMVGSVLVKNNTIIGKGYHKFAGGDHAEIMAIKSAISNIKGATLYVSLEPCCHFGKTPPCTQSIIESGIRKVVIACRDADEKVNGKGITELKNAGVKIKYGVLKNEALQLNEGYMFYKKVGTPFVIIKIAETLDGKIATSTGESKWIIGNEARSYVQKLRAGVDGIVVGSETVLQDNPELIVHSNKPYYRKPYRIVLDTRGRVPQSAKVFEINDTSPETYWIIGKNVSSRKVHAMQKNRIKVLTIPVLGNHLNLEILLKELGNLGVQSILVEGGSKIHGSFMDNKIIQKFIIFIAMKVMGGNKSITSIGGEGVPQLRHITKLRKIQTFSLGKDLVVEGYV